MDEDPPTLTGFKKVATIPIPFPLDTCIIHTDSEEKYIAALHRNERGSRQFTVMKMLNETYDQIASTPQPNAVSMDCAEFNGKGYVSIVQKNKTSSVPGTEDNSMIYEITAQHIKLIQNLSTPDLRKSILHVGHNGFYLFHITNNVETSCPYFKWSENMKFKIQGNISCPYSTQNMRLFTINEETYIALAVYGNEKSRILKFSQTSQKFELFQEIQTPSSMDVEYFETQEEGEHTKQFLIFSSSGKDNSGVYVFNDLDQFIPFQQLPISRVKKIKVVQLPKSLFLLASYGEDDIRLFHFDHGMFHESSMHFTGHNFYVHQEDEHPCLLISHRYRIEDTMVVYKPEFRNNPKIHKLKQDIMDWLESESKRVQTNDIEELTIKVQNKRGILESYGAKLKRDISAAKIDTVSTKMLVYPNRKISTNYWKALSYINQALDILERDILQKPHAKRHSNNKDQGQDQADDLEYDTFKIKELTLNNKLQAKKINQIDVGNPEFKEIHAKKITIYESFMKPPIAEERFSDVSYLEDNEILMIRNLNINGKLNEYTWNDLLNDTLKRAQEEEEQIINAANVKIKNLETPRIVVTGNVVNQQHLSSLIPIDGGEYTIKQDIQFAQPIRAKAVQINERLNNVRVLQGKLDVLLRRSNETQVIEGPKSMRNVKVMEPITIAGQMLGRHLESITPNKAIHEPLQLQGDFMINGDVDINRLLKTGDIIDLREKMSVRQTLDRGIRMNKTLEDIKLKFLQPIVANNTLVSFVNRNDLQRLVKLNQDEIQIIEGVKQFAGSLEISRGFSEFKNLNGIDMEKLEKNSFLRNNNQTIGVPMKVGKIQAKSINSTSILINNRNITEYLTKSTNQTINGNLIV
uniref:Uncharacterized protein n=1 Tax=Musca domestica TaxID=7370 RepID=A0A1I8MPT8_MUSDO